MQPSSDFLAQLIHFKQLKKAASGKKAPEPPKEPGAESALGFEQPVDNDRLAEHKKLVRNLVFSINQLRADAVGFGSDVPLSYPFTVHGRTFYPHEWLCEPVALMARQFLMAAAYAPQMLHEPGPNATLIPGAAVAYIPPSGSAPAVQNATLAGEELFPYRIKRPSAMLSDVKAYTSGLQLVDSWLDTNFHQIVHTALLEQADAENSKKFTVQGDAKAGAPAAASGGRNVGRKPLNLNQPVLITYINWYLDLVATKATSGTIWHSPAKRCFVSRPIFASNGNPMEYLRVEEYTDGNGGYTIECGGEGVGN